MCNKDTKIELKEFCSIREAMRITGINQSNIVKCCKGKIKTAGGYYWKYKNQKEEYVCGYRSEVKVCMRKSDYEELKGRLEVTGDNDTLDLFKEDTFCDFNYQELGDVVVFGWNWIKWYGEYKEVAFIENFLNEIEEQGHPYQFVRIGEESGDIEILRSYGETGEDYSCDRINPVSYIEIE